MPEELVKKETTNCNHPSKESKPLSRVITILVMFLVIMMFGAGCSRETENGGSQVNSGGQTQSGEETDSGANSGGQTYSDDAPSFTPETYPRVDGSTVTIPLSEALAARMMDMSPEEVRPYILHNKTHQAYVNLIEKKTDLIFVTAPSKEELALAKAAGVEFEIIPVVSEAFVFLVNADNPIAGLTPADLQSIYTGKMTNWSEVGGNDLDIIPYQRPVNSGSQTGFLEMVMPGLTPMDPPMEQVVAEMGMLIDAVASFENGEGAIGYSYYYFVMDMWGAENIKLIEVDGIAPTPESITSGTYPFTTAYYAIMRQDEPENSPARQVVNWLLSDGGQTLAEETGYVRVK
jgi:phosphate transport system substrate-binding protein